ncbi:MAG: thioredoxin family protein [Flavobacteriales bacterium]|nr:thioredoxin family protein [Flavobacteriales bacterium]
MAIQTANDATFSEVLKSNENVIVKYYADWCGSCKLFAPKYRRLSDNEAYSQVVFLDVNAEESPEARKLAGVDNLPFFAVFKNGELLKGSSTSKEENVVELINLLNA